jgi:hypothetical protein
MVRSWNIERRRGGGAVRIKTVGGACGEDPKGQTPSKKWQRVRDGKPNLKLGRDGPGGRN